MNSIRVLLVDDRPDNSAMARLMLDREPDIDVIGEQYDARDLTRRCREDRIDVVLLDLRMPGPPPLEALKELVTEIPECRVIVCSGFDDPELVQEAIDAGAWGFVSKSRPTSELVRCIRTVAQGETCF